jgi:predicted Zn-dependent protease
MAAVLETLNSEINTNSHPYACNIYGLALLKIGRAKQAAAAFAKGLEKNPDDYSLTHNLGIALMQAGRYGEAGDVLVKAASRAEAGLRPSLLYLAAQCAYLDHKPRRALTLLKPFLAGPEAAESWIYLAAVASLECGERPLAEQYFDRLVRSRPGKREYWKGLAHARLQQGKNPSAIAALEVAKRLPGSGLQDRDELSRLYMLATAPLLSLRARQGDAENPEQRDMRIRCLERANRHAELVSYLDSRIAVEPGPELFWLKGRSLYRMGRLHEALAAFSGGGRFGGEAAARCAMMAGMLAWEAGDLQDARNRFTALAENEFFGTEASQALLSLESIERLLEELSSESGKPELSATVSAGD